MSAPPGRASPSTAERTLVDGSSSIKSGQKVMVDRTRGDLWGSKSHRCSSGRIVVLVDGAAEDAGAQEFATLEVLLGDGLLVVGRW